MFVFTSLNLLAQFIFLVLFFVWKLPEGRRQSNSPAFTLVSRVPIPSFLQVLCLFYYLDFFFCPFLTFSLTIMITALPEYQWGRRQREPDRVECVLLSFFSLSPSLFPFVCVCVLCAWCVVWCVCVHVGTQIQAGMYGGQRSTS